MTDEEMASNYADTVKCEWENETYWVDCRDKVEDAFLAGLKAGRPKWHDLRKDPKDLPPKIKGMCISKYVLSENGTLVYYDYKNKMFATYMIVPTEVIAWCEIPTFTDTE